MNIYKLDELKDLPKKQAKSIWKEAIVEFKKAEPKKFYRCCLPGGIGGGLGAFIGFQIKNSISQEFFHPSLLYPLILSGLLAGIGSLFNEKNLYFYVQPYIQKLRETM